MKVKCPRCGAETIFEGNPFRPFCSERCKLVDLGNWISESYRIPVKDSDANDESVPRAPEDREDK